LLTREHVTVHYSAHISVATLPQLDEMQILTQMRFLRQRYFAGGAATHPPLSLISIRKLHPQTYSCQRTELVELGNGLLESSFTAETRSRSAAVPKTRTENVEMKHHLAFSFPSDVLLCSGKLSQRVRFDTERCANYIGVRVWQDERVVVRPSIRGALELTLNTERNELDCRPAAFFLCSPATSPSPTSPYFHLSLSSEPQCPATIPSSHCHFAPRYLATPLPLTAHPDAMMFPFSTTASTPAHLPPASTPAPRYPAAPAAPSPLPVGSGGLQCGLQWCGGHSALRILPCAAPPYMSPAVKNRSGTDTGGTIGK
jgi:hypothetical protein